MILKNSVTLARNADELYTLLIDLDSVAPCIPGATVGPTNDDGSRAASIHVRLGPMRFEYAGSVAIVEEHEGDRRAVLEARGEEVMGEGAARATMAMAITPKGSDATVEIETDLHDTGRVAQMGRGLIEEVSQEMLEDFAACLQRRAEGRTASGESASPPKQIERAQQGGVGIGRLLLRIVSKRFRGVIEARRPPIKRKT